MELKSDAVEGLLSTTLVTIYNITDSLRVLVCSPVKGPIRLVARRQSSATHQVGPYTLLFVAVCLVFFLAGKSEQQLPWLRDALLYQKTPVDLLIGAFVTVTIVDVAIRCLGRMILKNDPRRRTRFLAIALYSVCAQAGYTIIFLIASNLWAGFS
jgi:hypothetical protein